MIQSALLQNSIQNTLDKLDSKSGNMPILIDMETDSHKSISKSIVIDMDTDDEESETSVTDLDGDELEKKC